MLNYIIISMFLCSFILTNLYSYFICIIMSLYYNRAYNIKIVENFKMINSKFLCIYN